ncbi:ubiquinol-cytochrome c reductase iron-sulfur subunit [Fuerstiella marisgermanici]|uniref:Cytochrome b6-f complex iron-sulfur subunit n=1 Tax=Fuerstiella marisgermanici TaxID=1891926 RepID=A0A1P8WJ40_9PLAN|nr:ubiquinol-cytochrome c reductase iron-sulfur subunit [Fuerstiella marisgermanici]APZ94071.1 Cytochrome b6-f complex iron-sulfur subunit [Fuerstiella marisgermanici]
MSDKNPSSEDILARIRGGAPAPKPSADDAAPVDEATNESEAAAEKPDGPPPSGTSDILASIKGGGAPKAAAKPSGAAPKGTADILASIKGGGGGAAAKPAGGAAPSGTASILASIKGGGASKPAAGGAAAKKPAAKAAAVDAAKAKGMSAAEMIEAARKGVVTADPVTGEPTGAAKAVALPKKPLKKKADTPFAAPKAKSQDVSRRGALGSIAGVLLSPVVIAWSSLTAATAASGLAMARFMMPNVLVEPPTKFKIGPQTDYGAGTVATKWKAQFGVWIVNDEIDGQQMVYALSTVCTHLGCTPNWLEGEQKFKCPCHGSGFYKTGVNFEGPAPRPLERYGIRLAEDGMLEVDKSVKFQQELGQWENAASFVPV